MNSHQNSINFMLSSREKEKVSGFECSREGGKENVYGEANRKRIPVYN